MPKRSNASAVLGLVMLSALAVTAVHAQDYPTKPVKWVVAYPPGGTTDILARIVGQYLSEHLGQPFVIDNRPGAGNNIGTEVVVNSPPDGYTILLVNPANSINATLYKKLPFNFLRDIAPVAGITRVPNVMETTAGFPAKTVAEFIAYGKANPGKINMASSGNGTSVHLSGELFMAMTGIKMIHVPYRGAGPALTDLIAGTVDVMFDNLPSSIEFIKSGKLRALGRHHRQAQRCAAGRPRRRRNGRGLRGERLVRHRRAEGHARRHHRKAQPDGQRRPRRSQDEGEARRPRRHSDGRHARRVRKDHGGGDGKMGEGRQVLRCVDRLTLHSIQSQCQCQCHAPRKRGIQ